MRIKKLKLVGFKSFVEPAELRIENGLTGIVGPNGCGKSNLLEAVELLGCLRSHRTSSDRDLIQHGEASGQVRAWVGSSGTFSAASQVDGVLARRQPGSSFKPYVYGTAIASGHDQLTVYHDAPIALPSAISARQAAMISCSA